MTDDGVTLPRMPVAVAAELTAMGVIVAALDPLNQDQQHRILRYMNDRYGVSYD